MLCGTKKTVWYCQKAPVWRRGIKAKSSQKGGTLNIKATGLLMTENTSSIVNITSHPLTSTPSLEYQKGDLILKILYPILVNISFFILKVGVLCLYINIYTYIPICIKGCSCLFKYSLIDWFLQVEGVPHAFHTWPSQQLHEVDTTDRSYFIEVLRNSLLAQGHTASKWSTWCVNLTLTRKSMLCQYFSSWVVLY